MTTPEEIDVLRQSALDARSNGDHEKSLAQFQKLLDFHPGDQRSWIDMAISLRELSRRSEARDVLRRYLSTEPTANWRSLAIDNLVGITAQEVEALLDGGKPDAAIGVFEAFLDDISADELARHAFRIWAINLKILSFCGLEKALYRSKFAELTTGSAEQPAQFRTLLANHAINNGWYDEAQVLISQIDGNLGLRLRLADAKARTSMVDTDDDELSNEAKQSQNASFRKAAWTRDLYQAMYLADDQRIRNALAEIDACLAARKKRDSRFSVATVERIRMGYARSFLSSIRVVPGKMENSSEATSTLYLEHDNSCKTQEERVCLSQHYLSHVVGGDHVRSRTLSATAENEVPRAIVQFWDTRTIPDDVERCCRTWRAAAQRGFQYTLFNEEDAYDWLNDTYGSVVSSRFKRATHPAMKADWFRIFYLYEKGGIYIDADEYCKSLPPFFEKAARCVRLQRIVASVELPNMYLSLAKADPLLHEAAEIAMGMPEEELFNGRIWWNTGPGLFSVALARLHAAVALGSEKSLPWFIPMPLYTRHVFSPELDYKSTPLAWQFAAN